MTKFLACQLPSMFVLRKLQQWYISANTTQNRRKRHLFPQFFFKVENTSLSLFFKPELKINTFWIDLILSRLNSKKYSYICQQFPHLWLFLAFNIYISKPEKKLVSDLGHPRNPFVLLFLLQQFYVIFVTCIQFWSENSLL